MKSLEYSYQFFFKVSLIHINKRKDRNHWSISKDAEKALTNFNSHFSFFKKKKKLNEQDTENSFTLMKHTPTSSELQSLIWWNTAHFPYHQEAGKSECLQYFCSFREMKEIKAQVGYEELKVCVLTGNMITKPSVFPESDGKIIMHSLPKSQSDF